MAQIKDDFLSFLFLGDVASCNVAAVFVAFGEEVLSGVIPVGLNPLKIFT